MENPQFLWIFLYNNNAFMSKYADIEKEILSKIEDGTYPAGSKLPGELELMKIYGASRDTIRKALSLLAQEGYIQKTHGVGSTVLDFNRFEFPVNGVISFAELAETMKGNVTTKVICLEKTHPDARICQNLHLTSKDEVWLIQRVRQIDGEGIILDTDILNAEICPGITKEIAEDSLYKYLENELDLKIAYAEKQITCQPATNMDRRWLDMMNYDMVVNVESLTYLEDARVFQYTQSRHRPDKFIFRDFARRYRKA